METTQVFETEQVAEFPAGRWQFMGGSSHCVSAGEIAEKVFPEHAQQPFTPGARSYRGDMFAYLFRRFGYPMWGWDGYKQLVSYTLTTPDPQVMLTIEPSSRIELSFGYGVGPEIDALQRAVHVLRIDNWDDLQQALKPINDRVEAALVAAMRDLLRPVFIRDTAINLFGLLADWNEDATPEVERHPYSGYGVGDFDPTKDD